MSKKSSGLWLAAALAALAIAGGAVALLLPTHEVVERPPATRPNPLGKSVEPDLGRASSDATVAAASGCGRAVDHHDSIVRTLLGTRVVEWHLYVPDAYDPHVPAPVVFFFYDGVTATDDAMEHTRVRRLADALQAILIAPIRDTSQLDWAAHTTEDFSAALDAVAASHCVDLSRVFALGHETGGHPVVELSCEPWIRAVATTAFRLSSGDPPCEPWAPKPIMMFAPRDYPGLPIEGGTKCGVTEHLSLAVHEAIWWERNRCNARAETVEMEHGRCEIWTCAARSVSCVVDGGLSWRGAPRRGVDLLGCDGVPTSFDYITAIAEEFGRHR